MIKSRIRTLSIRIILVLSTQTTFVAIADENSTEGVKKRTDLEIFHPADYSIQAVENLFRTDPKAPRLDSLKKCDFDYNAEKMLAGDYLDLEATFSAHIRDQPQAYHFCFYGKILQFEQKLKNTKEIEQKKDLLLDEYLFFVNVGRIMRRKLGDPYYAEFARQNYIRINKDYFGRSLRTSRLKRPIAGEQARANETLMPSIPE